MPFIKLQFKPGVNRDQTDYSNEGGWFECDKIRFRSGYPEKIGGWQKATPNTFAGVCRQMNNWVTTYSDNLLSLGTNSKLYIEAGGYFNDITPLRSVNPTLTTPSTDNCIQTSTSAPTTITVVIPGGHGTQTGNYVTISGVVGPVGGDDRVTARDEGLDQVQAEPLRRAGHQDRVAFHGLRNSARVWMLSRKQPPSAVVLVFELVSITPRDLTQ